MEEKIYYKILWIYLGLKKALVFCEVDRVGFCHWYNNILSELSPLRPSNFTFTVERNYTIYRRKDLSKHLEYFEWTMAVHLSFVKQLLYTSKFSILYGWEINKLSCRYKYFTPATIWFVVRKSSKHRNPNQPQLMLSDTSTTLTTAPLNVRFSYKNKPTLRSRIPSQMRKNFKWKFTFLSSTGDWYLFWNPPTFDVENDLKPA